MPPRNSAPANDAWEGVFSGMAGIWLALSLIKFGNPVILDHRITAPASLDELLISPWPVAWGYGLLALVALLGLKFWRWDTGVPRWLLVVPLVWLGWQVASAAQTVDRNLTAATLPHFFACVTAFYLGLFALSRVTRLKTLWVGLVGGFVVVLIVGWRQHFGGLEETRQFFYRLPDWQNYPPELQKKVMSNRIYSTLVYPNALAGVVLLLLPVSFSILWSTGSSRIVKIRLVAAGVLGILSLGCLYWSGSKAGWLIALGQGVVVLVRLTVGKAVKILILSLALCVGLGGFWMTYQDYFGRGATSAAARLDYWDAAWKTLLGQPAFGSGPGTFAVSYKAIKPAEAETTQLVHNDLLQQGSDSGWIGLLSFVVWLGGGVLLLYRRSISDWPRFCAWIGVVGMVTQSLVEFGLYIPALAWPFFVLFGWMLGTSRPPFQIDNAAASP